MEEINKETGEITQRKRKATNTWLKLKQFADKWEEHNDGEKFLILPMHHSQIKPIAEIEDDEYTDRLNSFFSVPFIASNKIAQTPIALVRNWNALGKKREPPTELVLKHICNGCNFEVSLKKSEWQRWANKTVVCQQCKKPFNVNDILEQVPTLSQIIKEQ